MQDPQDFSNDASCGLCDGPMPCNCEDARTEHEIEAQHEQQQDTHDLYERYAETID